MTVTVCMQFYFVFINHYHRFQYVEDVLTSLNVHHLAPEDTHHKNDSLKTENQTKIMTRNALSNNVAPQKHLTSRDLFNLVRQQNKGKNDTNGVAQAVAALKSRFAERKTANAVVPDANTDHTSDESSDGDYMQDGKKK